jgi:RND superfamily putative drug exporter
VFQATAPDAPAQVVAAMARLRQLPGVRVALSGYETGDPNLISPGASTSLGVISLEGTQGDVEQLVPSLRAELSQLSIPHFLTGLPAINYDAFLTSEDDLRRSELVTVPVALGLLLLVFRTVVSAAVPLVLGASNVVLGLAVLALVGARFELSIFALNVASMIGLGLGLDFALIVISRFRAERAAGVDPETSLARTMATAGHSIAFSSLTVMLAMLAATIFLRDLMIVRSMTLAVGIVAGASLRPARPGQPGIWYRLSHAMMQRPVAWFVVSLLILCALAIPAFRLRVYGATPGILPAETESVAGARVLAQAFGSARLEPLQIVLQHASSTGVDRLVQTLGQDPRVLAVQPRPAANTMLVTAYARTGQYDPEHQALVYDLRQRIIPGIPELRGAEVAVGGDAAYFLDFRDALYARFPAVIAAVTLAVFIVLARFFQSVFLPIKAIFMNLVSILATYGLLVLIFQDGFASGPLGFHSLGAVFMATPVVLYVILFALSSDYEVFMLSRVKEHYQRTGDNTEAVATGLEATGGVITAAGLILIGTFGSFATASILTLKEIGLGLAIGVLLDATIVRVIMVPAAMRLMGERNWWPGSARRAGLITPSAHQPVSPDG